MLAPWRVLPEAKDVTPERPGVGSTGGTELGDMRPGSVTRTGRETLGRLLYFPALDFLNQRNVTSCVSICCQFDFSETICATSWRYSLGSLILPVFMCYFLSVRSLTYKRYLFCYLTVRLSDLTGVYGHSEIY